MNLLDRLTAPNPASRAPLSIKALLYDCLMGFFVWMFVYCALITDPKHNPYGHPVMMAGVFVALFCLMMVFALWVTTVIRTHAKWLDLLLPLPVTLLLYVPAIWTCKGMYELGAWVLHSVLGV